MVISALLNFCKQELWIYIYVYTGCPKKFDVILNANISETTRCSWLVVGFYGISTTMGYLMPNLVYTYMNYI